MRGAAKVLAVGAVLAASGFSIGADDTDADGDDGQPTAQFVPITSVESVQWRDEAF